jgi:hypothetical protein
MPQVKKLSVAKVAGKITAATVMTVIDGKPAPNPNPVFVMRAGGVASGIKTGVSDYGPWKCLTGDFVAYGPDGVEQRAPYLFLPEVAQIPIETALTNNQGAAVTFLVDVQVKADKESSVGYVYTFEPVVRPGGADPIAALLAQAAPLKVGDKTFGGALALEAPKDDPAPAPAPAGKGSKGSK